MHDHLDVTRRHPLTHLPMRELAANYYGVNSPGASGATAPPPNGPSQRGKQHARPRLRLHYDDSWSRFAQDVIPRLESRSERGRIPAPIRVV
jgi:hypothetical protein